MSDTRDSVGVMVSVGVVVPAALVALAGFNVVTGRVILWDEHRSCFAVMRGFWYVLGAVLAKVGFAGALGSWFLLANLRATERTAQVWLLASIGVAGAGVIVVLIHVFA